MRYVTADQSQIDRAREWTAETYPEATGAEYKRHFAAALADILSIDAATDTAMVRLESRRADKAKRRAVESAALTSARWERAAEFECRRA